MNLVLVTNPRSRKNRKTPAEAIRLRDQLGGRGRFVEPDSLDALAAAAQDWHRDGVDTVAINGGDGTVHRVVTAINQAWGEDPLPALCVLPGGTMNIVGHDIGAHAPKRQLQRLLDGVTEATHRRLLCVGDQSGFLFGNGIVARFLEVYYAEGESSPVLAAQILAKGVASAMVGGPLAASLTQRYAGTVEVDGTPWVHPDWMAVAIGTVEQMGLGFRVFPLTRSHPDALHVLGIGSGIRGLASELPRLYAGRGLAHDDNREQAASRVVLRDEGPIGFMIDGDFHSADDEVVVEVGPRITFLV